MRIGTAGWGIPRGSAHRFRGEGTHLQRYALVFTCAEINSSFYRPHTQRTYAKWADATPETFKFSVKMPRAITHEARLTRSSEALRRFLGETEGLGTKRGPVLMQLPPSLAFEPLLASRFFSRLRTEYEGAVVCEPRHETWASAAATRTLLRYRIARVAADPPRAAEFAVPGGWEQTVYFRLHGSPRTYWSSYPMLCLEGLALALRRLTSADVWCVFDNTASGAAIENASTLLQMPH